MGRPQMISIDTDGFDEGRIASCLEANMMRLMRGRRPWGTICPTEAARWAGAELGLDWRALLQPARELAVELAERGVIEMLQRGHTVDARHVQGPVRVRLRTR
ncbi:MAG TPA: DUF3253 domain-containing protein [Candidatus Saccharimonadia bacterium]|nr:DUF3253 domain-containing protein [Candidatus Saccharimonadia bacterium]